MKPNEQHRPELVLLDLHLPDLHGREVLEQHKRDPATAAMPHTGAVAGAACCERLRSTIRDGRWDLIATGMRLTASAGVATADDASDLHALAELADRRLYEAKRSGRDRVVV